MGRQATQGHAGPCRPGLDMDLTPSTRDATERCYVVFHKVTGMEESISSDIVWLNESVLIYNKTRGTSEHTFYFPPTQACMAPSASGGKGLCTHA